LTALLGRNESGKSNLLKALASLNPSDGFKALSSIKDFPRHRKLSECTLETPVVWTRWSLDDSERSELDAIFPRAGTATHVTVSRAYKGETPTVGFEALPPLAPDQSEIKTKIRKIASALAVVADGLDATHKPTLSQAAEQFETQASYVADAKTWASNAVAAVRELSKVMAATNSELPEKAEQTLTELGDQAKSIVGDEESHKNGRQWVMANLPKFIYLDEYPDLEGHQNVTDYVQRKSQGQRKPSDDYFAKLCKVGGINPEELQANLNDPETRNQLANRASAVVTTEIRKLWKDRSLKIRFNVDGAYFDTLISDPTESYDVEVNLKERSRGFQWFFSFYITFSADTDGGSAANAILLLDEPGLYLHAKSQTDLLNHFDSDFDNQIIYSTHSPFMVPTHKLDSVRTVNIGDGRGTTVTNDPSGDSKTLFPLQAALGYDLAQSLFVGPNNLVVEGVTDFWILSAISDFLNDSGRVGLNPSLVLTPAGGAQKISYMVALLSSERLNVVVLLDEEKEARSTRDELVKARLISERNVVFVTEAFRENPPKEADIEDLIGQEVYDALVCESYVKELKGNKLALNANIPRVAKRFDVAFAELGIPFKKTRPSRLMLKKMAENPNSIVTTDVAARFENLFRTVNARFEKAVEKGDSDLRPSQSEVE
jgi:predicted ATPase